MGTVPPKIPDFDMPSLEDSIVSMFEAIAEPKRLEPLSGSIAKLTRAIYNSLRDEGFDHDDAMVLVSAMAQRGK